MAKPETARRLLTRVTDNGGHLLHFRCDRVGARAGNSSSSFISKEHVPDFEGHEAWFELERVSAKPWPYWRATRLTEPPPGWTPSAPPRKRHPSELLGSR